MKQQRTLLIVLLAFVLLLVAAYLLYNNLSDKVDVTPPDTDITAATPGDTDPTGEGQQTTQKPQNPAPDFTVYDGQGNPVKLSDYFGKPIVLNFWASWCPPCKAEMPHFEEAFKELDGQVQFLMINATGGRETVTSAKAFIAQTGYTFPVLYDTDAMASYVYQAYSLPTTYFIDAEGNLVAREIGMIDKDRLMANIERVK